MNMFKHQKIRILRALISWIALFLPICTPIVWAAVPTLVKDINNEDRMIKKLTSLAVILSLILFFLASCGGGGAGEGGNGGSNVQLASAASFSENLAILDTSFNQTTINRWAQYDALPSELINVFNWSQTNNIINGRYFNYVSPNEPFANVYPEINADLRFSPTGSTQQLSYSAVDLTNGVQGEGDFQTFFGVKDVEFINGQTTVPIVILTRGVVRLNGSPLYRMVQVFEGHLTSFDISPNGPAYDGVPGSLFTGHYALYSTERLGSLGFDPGLIIEYDNYLVRQDTSGGGGGGGGGGGTNFTSTDIPVTINDNSILQSVVLIQGAGTVADINVGLSITHTFTGDLSISLRSPSGTVVLLSNRNGSSGDNYTNTVFDDEASIQISDAAAPFTGNFRPDQNLSFFNGESISGTWRLMINDQTAGDVGTLDNWFLTISQQ